MMPLLKKLLPLALVVPLVAIAAPAQAAPGDLPPQQDPFYTAPANIASYTNGQVVASRPLAPRSGVDASKVTAWQISYRTADSHNAPEMTVTTLLVPKKAYRGVRPLVSFQMAEDSTGLQCSPSYSLSSDLTGAGIYGVAFGSMITPLLDKGWAVVVPDFEGPKSGFMTGIQAGHAVLDSLRAARSFAPGGLSKANPVALYGYSGGGQATGWGAELQPSYAPEITIKGTAMGGTPADPEAVARFLDGGIFSGFEAAAAFSYDAEYPEAQMQSILNDKGRAAIPKATGQCLSIIMINFPFAKLSAYTTVPDPLAVPSIAKVLKANTLGSAVPASPIYDYHAKSDEIVPVAQDDTLVKQWCAAGAKVVRVRDDWSEHATELLVGQDKAISYLDDRLTGKTPIPSTC